MKSNIEKWAGGLQVYLRQKAIYRRFCWISMGEDGSLFFNFTSKTTKLTEYGTSVLRSGYFIEHPEIPVKGNMDIKLAKQPHISFHPPSLNHKWSIAHFKDGRRTVTEWRLDWFPVRKAQLLMYAFSGNIEQLDAITKPTGDGSEIIIIPDNTSFVQMDLFLYPNLDIPQLVGRLYKVPHLIGRCPHYMVSCMFYPSKEPYPLSWYVVNDIEQG